MLKGGGLTMDKNKNILQKPGEDVKESPTHLKRHASQGRHSEDSPPKRSKLLNEYKQRTPRKSPHKTPTKKKTPRLKCQNVLCRVGFTSSKSKLRHERFLCPYRKTSPSPLLRLSSSSHATSTENEKTCRFCDKTFSNLSSRVRHERNKHQLSGSSSASSQLFDSPTPDLHIPQESFELTPSPQLESSPHWRTPKRLFKRKSQNNNDQKLECKFCKQSFRRLYSQKLHEESCSFKVPPELAFIQVPRVRIVQQCEKLASMLNFTCVEDLYEYNVLASLCVPGIYPLVFSGQSHSPKIPPILKKTAYNRSLDILFKLLRLHGEVTLRNQLILIDETSNMEIFLGPQLLIPESSSRIEILRSDMNTTTVALKPHEDSEETSEDSEGDEDVEISFTHTQSVCAPPIPDEPVDDDGLISDVRLPEEIALLDMFPCFSSDALADENGDECVGNNNETGIRLKYVCSVKVTIFFVGQFPRNDSCVRSCTGEDTTEVVDVNNNNEDDENEYCGDPPDGDPSDDGDSGNEGDSDIPHNESIPSSPQPSLTPPPSSPPPSPSPSPPRSPGPSFPLPDDHTPGTDGTGTMPLRQRRAMCLLRRPLCLDPEDFINKFKMTKEQFVKWAESSRNAIQRTRELDYLAQALLFLHKILNDVSFSSLSVDFVLPKHSVRRIFWNILMFQYQNNLNVPRLVYNHSTVDEQVNRLLTESLSSTPPLVQNIFRHFCDPSGRGRIPVVLLLDATYLSVQDSADINLHKSLFYGPKKDHIVKLVCLTNCTGKVVGMLPLACSQSPTCGDSFLLGHFIELEESDGALLSNTY